MVPTLIQKRKFSLFLAGIIMVLAVADACKNMASRNATDNFRDLVPAFIKDSIYLSATNPFSAGKAAIGRYLFYDRRLSVNNSKACASCHSPGFSFTDGYRRSIGALGDNVQHNAPALVNVVFNKYLTAADSTLHFPEQQINNPMFHQSPPELGWAGNEQLILARLRTDSLYSHRLPALFPGEQDAFTVQHIQDCISSFVKTILSFNAPLDQYTYKRDSAAMSASALKGMRLFFADRLHCKNCHGGINFSVPSLTDADGKIAYYQNTGLYNIDGLGSYPVHDRGLIEYTKQPVDMGRFRVASLRNLAFTAPYLHDGSAATLEEVIAIYAGGGRHTASPGDKGNGSTNPYKNPLIAGFSITPQEKKELVDFLLSLSDSSACNNNLYNNPFSADETRAEEPNR
ncbi:MAG: MbnH family di-heme enzyme [Chitinophagaceae bacterium]